MAVTKVYAKSTRPDAAIRYILNGDKTDGQILTAHFNCDPGWEYRQMMDTKRELGKTGGRLAYHIIQSFKPGEVTPELALEIAKELAEQSANGTYADFDRGELQKEVEALADEINRIATNANFNGQTLFAGMDSDGDGTADTDLSLTLQIGDSSGEQLTVTISDLTAATGSSALGIYSIDATSGALTSSVDISTQGGASTAIDTIKSAIDVVSGVRGGLGALQNRLEHTINNLSVMQENMQDAESTIRDTDVANEMMKYTKNSILVQSAQAMLAQANQQPQGVLQLLQ